MNDGCRSLGGVGRAEHYELLMMFAANVVLLVSFGQRWMRLCALLAGTGFGLFIDEVGKFITADNNYFFKPALSVIYICFLVLFGLRGLFTAVRGHSKEA